MQMYLNIMDKINSFLKIILFIFLFTAMVALALQVLFRFVLSSPLSWSAELSSYLMVWVTFIGAGLAVRHGRLIKLEVLLFKMPPKPTHYIGIIAGVISISFYIILIIFGIDILGTVKQQQSASLPISMVIPYSAIPVGAFIMICNTLAAMFDGEKGEERS